MQGCKFLRTQLQQLQSPSASSCNKNFMPMYLAVLLIAATQWQSAFAATYRLDVTMSTAIRSPDGIPRKVLTINGKTPGPTIIVNTGDRIIANFTNIDIAQGSTVHWHGIRQALSNNMDGVPFVTQSPVFPGQSFLYDFFVDEPGTYWYHSHVLEQYVAGAKAAFIVRDPKETWTYSDRVVFLSDWYNKDENGLVETDYLIPRSGGVEPVPNTALINGVGQNLTCATGKSNRCSYSEIIATKFSASCGVHKTYDNLLKAQNDAYQAGGSDDELITRLRLIQGSGFAAFNFSIDSHYLWILALDGQPVVPHRSTSFIINPGQRVDVALCRMSPFNSVEMQNLASPLAYQSSAWIRAIFEQDAFGYTSTTNGVQGILSYSSSAYQDYATGPSTTDFSLALAASQIYDGLQKIPIRSKISREVTIKASSNMPLPVSGPSKLGSGDPSVTYDSTGGSEGYASLRADTSSPWLAGLYPLRTPLS
jgi:Multicopper oxidase